MENFGMKFHHIGLAVLKPEASVAFLKGIGYTAGETIYDPAQNVNLIMCENSAGMPDIEVIFPPGNGAPSPIDAIVQACKTRGTLYHLCYETSDIAKSVESIESGGHKVFPVSEPAPAILFGEKKVGFYLIKGFGMIELLENNE
jgi:methylmalonyl-CoA/ethylmalonyl-CoA epimerase